MKNRKIAIITLFGNFNFGNRLQNFAMQEFLNAQGLSVISIYRTNIYDKKLKNNIKIFMRYFYSILTIKGKRSFKFWKFTKKNINMICVKSNADYIKLEHKFDYFVVGSDQVWNPQFYEKPYEEFLLFTAPQKKIPIAVSFGLEKIPSEKEEELKECLATFNNFSVREDKAAQIVKKLVGKDALTLIDPTMMLKKKDWDKYLSEIEISKKYIFVYFLGEITDEYKEFIESMSFEYDLRIINILDKKNEYYASDPFDFITLISKSSLVITDSFHGSVFSIIYHIPLVVCSRKDDFISMNSRIETLVNKFDISDRLFENVKKVNIFNNKYTGYDEKINKEREKVLNYLESCLKSNEE